MQNITPANRVAEIKEYYFSRKIKEVARLKAEGKDIISLGIGGPDRPPHPYVIKELSEIASRDDSHSYQNYQGIPELRMAFSKWYEKYYGVPADPEREILPLIGSKEGITHISLTFLNPGDKVLVPNPGYPTYSSASRLVGAEVVTYDLLPSLGWYPDFEALEEMDLSGVKLMWVNYPNMPTGAPATIDVFERLVDFGRRHGIVIAHDNPYSFILNDFPLSIMSVDGAKDIAVELNSLSKSHNMAGWRVAMLVSNPTFVGWIQKVKSNVDSGQFLPVMRAAVKALELDKDWYDNLNREYFSRKQIAIEIMKSLGCDVSKGQQGLFVWGRIPDDEIDAESLADRLLYQAGVFVTPGSVFGSNGAKYIRISLCATEDKMNEALRRIKSLQK